MVHEAYELVLSASFLLGRHHDELSHNDTAQQGHALSVEGLAQAVRVCIALLEHRLRLSLRLGLGQNRRQRLRQRSGQRLRLGLGHTCHSSPTLQGLLSSSEASLDDVGHCVQAVGTPCSHVEGLQRDRQVGRLTK